MPYNSFSFVARCSARAKGRGVYSEAWESWLRCYEGMLRVLLIRPVLIMKVYVRVLGIEA
jgi:hypothetical protein